ncbi:hypothetical protein MJG53_009638 [Ovis ammon polii x Ovis aries]|uniref:Uncharacterized protein n=1 Tax=Ovis ammon polii x Ovis aries TaxID=2918886 RepID=A0ACB9UXE5_9CETA|nr:hypothetical protein MJG53_009638 [Ovis ammon polii x Ovis aries]
MAQGKELDCPKNTTLIPPRGDHSIGTPDFGQEQLNGGNFLQEERSESAGALQTPLVNPGMVETSDQSDTLTGVFFITKEKESISFSFVTRLFSTFSDRKARCLSASFSASEATVRVMQTCLSRPRWQWEEVRDGGWVGGVCGSGGKGADGAVTTVPDLRFRRVKEIVTCVPRVTWEAWEGLFYPEDIFLTFTLRAEIQAAVLSSRSGNM